jgi:hypothetical protein
MSVALAEQTNAAYEPSRKVRMISLVPCPKAGAAISRQRLAVAADREAGVSILP